MEKIVKVLVGASLTGAAAFLVVVSDIEAKDEKRLEVAVELEACAQTAGSEACRELIIEEVPPNLDLADDEEDFLLIYPEESIISAAEEIRNESSGVENKFMSGGAVVSFGGLLTLLAVSDRSRRFVVGDYYSQPL